MSEIIHFVLGATCCGFYGDICVQNCVRKIVYCTCTVARYLDPLTTDSWRKSISSLMSQLLNQLERM